MIVRALTLMLLLPLAAPAPADGVKFRPWAESLFLEIARQYGQPAADRMRRLHDLVVENGEAPVATRLRVANDAINGLPWIADRDKYDQEDYWATPLETIATFGGDCEDMAIAKFMMLRLMGVPAERLRLAYARVKATGESHMVLVYLEAPGGSADGPRALVLDTLDPKIRPGTERRDLLAVYLVDAERNITLIEDDGRNRSVKAEISDARMAKLDKIKAQIRANRTRYAEFNEGRPLW